MLMMYVDLESFPELMIDKTGYVLIFWYFI